jgi:hypothetical protein
MNANPGTMLFVAAALLAGCVVAPPRPDPELVRLQAERSRLHADPRVTAYAAGELRVADAAVDLLANEERRLDAADFSHGAYLADRHLLESFVRKQRRRRLDEALPGVGRGRIGLRWAHHGFNQCWSHVHKLRLNNNVADVMVMIEKITRKPISNEIAPKPVFLSRMLLNACTA